MIADPHIHGIRKKGCCDDWIFSEGSVGLPLARRAGVGPGAVGRAGGSAGGWRGPHRRKPGGGMAHCTGGQPGGSGGCGRRPDGGGAGRGGVGYGARADVVGALVMLLVAFVGWVIVRYSQTYLQGERRELHYVRWLLATLATVLVVVATDHLLVLALAWTATSLTLHHLLTFFGDRPAAVVAAHKKFIVARLADVCMLGATALLWVAYGTPHIHAMLAQAAGAPCRDRCNWPWCCWLYGGAQACATAVPWLALSR